MKCRLSGLLLCTLLSNTVYGEIYRWTDEHGKVHFSDTPQARFEQTTVALKLPAIDWKPLDIQVTAKDAGINAKDIQRIQHDVNLVYRFYTQQIYFNVYKTIPVHITVLSDQESYNQYLLNIIGQQTAPSWGMFIGQRNEIVVFLRDNADLTFATLKHEVSHAIVHSIAPNTPAWLNEGIAEQMENLLDQNGRLVLLRHNENHRVVRYLHQRNQLKPLQQLLDLQSTQWRHQTTQSNGALQAVAGELVYFLLANVPGRSFVKQLLHEYKRGSALKSLYLIDKHYVMGVDGLQVKWQQYLNENNTPSVHF
ncbi:MAG: DUF4124 domain-containing protein [Hahellaceae bacterium]|nr:DUF4124 domain-containing protein [Hahellaceae bacterium]MCP5169767.1 DUF4124 domain-containing protein [Hahellaceae bacterium]